MTDSLQRAFLLFNQGRYDLALAEVERSLSEDIDSAAGHALRSYCLTVLDQPKEGEEAARHAIELQPENPFGFFVLCRALKAQKNLAGAKDAINTAIEIDPENGDHWTEKAGIEIAQYDWKEAISSLDHALAIDPKDSEALLLRSHALHALGRTREAEEMSRLALQVNPELAFGHFERGWSLLRLGKVHAAEQQFLEALRIDADLAPAREGLKEAIRSRFAPYRWITEYQHWLTRFSPRVRVALLFGVMIAINVPYYLAKQGSALSTILLLLVLVYAAFAYVSWITRPLANFFLLFHPMGRHALSATERNGTAALGAVFALTALSATGWLTGQELRMDATLKSLALGIPVTTIFLGNSQKRIRIMGLPSFILFLMGPVSTVLISNFQISKHSILGGLVLFGLKNFWLGIGISTWISSSLGLVDED